MSKVQQSITLLKKLKKHEREALAPLYAQHTTYLLRMIKTATLDNDDFKNKIETFQKVATCHEIAINQYSELSIDTHRNEKGVEAKYTTHSKAKNVSRDRRVRIIWAMIYERFDEIKTLEKFDASQFEQIIHCDICNESIATIKDEIISFCSDNACDCMSLAQLIADDFYIPQNFIDYVIDNHITENEITGTEMIDKEFQEIVIKVYAYYRDNYEALRSY